MFYFSFCSATGRSDRSELVGERLLWKLTLKAIIKRHLGMNSRQEPKAETKEEQYWMPCHRLLVN